MSSDGPNPEGPSPDDAMGVSNAPEGATGAALPSSGSPSPEAPSSAPTPEGADAQATATPPAPRRGSPPVEKKWYIVHTYSGQEARAKQGLIERAAALGFEGTIDEVLIPEENVVEMIGGKKRTSKRKFFPGYILVRMELSDETWHVVKGTPKITGFVGNATQPPSISDDEVARMTQRIKEGASKPKPLISFEEGESVRVTTGPFASFAGSVAEVMVEKEKLRVMVQVFGRATPVVLDYTNVEKA
jgi:transcriptional antiterminator NusG